MHLERNAMLASGLKITPQLIRRKSSAFATNIGEFGQLAPFDERQYVGAHKIDIAIRVALKVRWNARNEKRRYDRAGQLPQHGVHEQDFDFSCFSEAQAGFGLQRGGS